MSMVGKWALGAAAALGLCSEVALAQAPEPAAPAPPAAATPDEAPATAPPAEAGPSPEAAPTAPAPALAPATDLDPAPKPRVRWKESSETAPEGEGEEQDGATDEASPPVPTENVSWELGGAHFVLSFERLTTVLSWKQTSKAPTGSGSFSAGATTDVSTSGTDVSFLFGGGERTPSSLPRIAFDGIFSGGFTLGGSLGLMSSTGKNESNALRQESALSDTSGALFGVRAGYFAASSRVGFWLRGGFTYLGATSEATVPGGNGSSLTYTAKVSVSAWALTLDPQLVLVAAPRVAITLGPLFDIPIAGREKLEANGQTAEAEHRNSGYGITAGASAIF